MTGFGNADGSLNDGRLGVEVRTVNHRHFSAQFRLPSELQPLEADLRSHLRARLDRGHASVSARWIEEPPRDVGVRVNVERARAVLAALEELRVVLGLEGRADLPFVARQPDVFTWSQDDPPPVPLEPVVAILDRAIDGVVATRTTEGAALAADLRSRIAAMGAALARVEQGAPERVVAERERLRQAVAVLLEGRALDPARLDQEIALLADKLDVTEETVRLRAHLATFDAALDEDAPIGRRLSFLGQEMLREVNTIGSKANDLRITEQVIGMKGELEKIREQVENLE